VPQRPHQPRPHARSGRRRQHQLRPGVLPRRRHHRRQVRHPLPAPVRAARHTRRRRTGAPTHPGAHRMTTTLPATTVHDARAATVSDLAAADRHQSRFDPALDHHALNALLNLYDDQGRLQLDAAREATRRYFLNHVNQNTVFFHSLKEKLTYLVNEGYYESQVLDAYPFDTVKALFKQAYAHRFRFTSFLGAFKFFTSYTLKTFDGKRYLERFEDRVVMVALTIGRGDATLAY